jgi:hypothetical protein
VQTIDDRISRFQRRGMCDIDGVIRTQHTGGVDVTPNPDL